MPSEMKQIGSSVGIELECEDIPPEAFGGKPHAIPNGVNFRTTHDASIESVAELLGGLPVKYKDKIAKLRLEKSRIGVEIVSSIINTENPSYISAIKWLTNELVALGESDKSYRAGFHVHVNTPFDLKILKSIIRLGKYLEQVFFLIGGMGYDYRGKKNDSTYCRPITGVGPVCVPIPYNKFAQVFNVSDLLKSDSTNSFLVRYGNVNRFMGSRYVPVRYHWLNLFPMFSQGSLEFRVFNKSLNPFYLYAVIELCKAFSYYVIGSSFTKMGDAGLLTENSVFDIKGEEDRPKILDTFNYFVSISMLSEKPDVVDTLREILNLSDINSIILPQNYIHTHLRYHPSQRVPTHWEGEDYSPSVISSKIINRPNYQDIHTLAGEVRNPEPEENNDEDDFIPDEEEEQRPEEEPLMFFTTNNNPFELGNETIRRLRR